MFESEDLVHLVVADNSDTYYTNSGLQLSLKEKLVLELQENYQNILFLQNSIEGPEIANRKGQVLEDYTKTSWGKSREDVCSSKLLKALSDTSKGTKTVLVAELGAFAKVMKDKKDNLLKLDEISQSNRGKIIVIVPQDADESMSYLVGDDSIFTYGDKRCLCKPLQYRKENKSELFGNLAKSEQVTYFTQITESSCKSILINAQLSDTDNFLTAKELDNCSTLLHRLSNCYELRGDLGLMRKISITPKFEDVYEWASSLKNRDRLNKKAHELLKDKENKKLGTVLDEMGYKLTMPKLIKRSDPLVLDICSLQYPSSRCKTAADTQTVNDFKKMQTFIYYPRAAVQNPGVLKWLQELTVKYRCGEDDREAQLIDNIAKVMCFVSSRLYNTSAKETAYLDEYKKTLNGWLDITHMLAKAEKDLNDQMALLKETESETLYVQAKETFEGVKNWRDIYEHTTEAVTPLFNATDSISFEKAMEILRNAGNLINDNQNKADEEEAATQRAREFEELRKMQAQKTAVENAEQKPENKATLPQPPPEEMKKIDNRQKILADGLPVANVQQAAPVQAEKVVDPAVIEAQRRRREELRRKRFEET